MIPFACRCKFRFAVPDDQAGGTIQCPQCGRLNDIPTLDDLPHLDADGVFDIYVDRPTDDAQRLAELGIVYAKGTRDAEGDEIDLRGPVTRTTPPPIPLADEDDDAPADRPRPKYDPETGELIRPLDLRPEPDAAARAAAIPVAQAVISYATPQTNARRVSPWRVLLELFQPGNVMVMASVVTACLLLIVSAAIVNYGMVFIVVAPVFFAGAIVAHFGIVVEEIGPLEQDELPRPLRGLSWHEDLWGPFKKVAATFVILFWPLYVGPMLPQPWAFIAVWLATMGGLFFLPAVLLTNVTGGTWLNLRPDRVLGVVRAAGGQYVVSVVGAVLALATIAGGLLAVSVAIWNAFANTDYGGWLNHWFVAFPLLLIGVYLTHAWAWHLGLIYRARYERFPWVMQRHISTRRTSLDPATDYKGRAQRPQRSTEEKLRAIREADDKRRAEARTTSADEPSRYDF